MTIPSERLRLKSGGNAITTKNSAKAPIRARRSSCSQRKMAAVHLSGMRSIESTRPGNCHQLGPWRTRKQRFTRKTCRETMTR